MPCYTRPSRSQNADVRKKTLASFVVTCEEVSLIAEALITACRVVTDLTAAAVLHKTLVLVCTVHAQVQ